MSYAAQLARSCFSCGVPATTDENELNTFVLHDYLCHTLPNLVKLCTYVVPVQKPWELAIPSAIHLAYCCQHVWSVMLVHVCINASQCNSVGAWTLCGLPCRTTTKSRHAVQLGVHDGVQLLILYKSFKSHCPVTYSTHIPAIAATMQ